MDTNQVRKEAQKEFAEKLLLSISESFVSYEKRTKPFADLEYQDGFETCHGLIIKQILTLLSESEG